MKGTKVNMGRFLAVFGSILGDSGDHLGMFWARSGGSRACCSSEKATYINFKIDFLRIGGECAVFFFVFYDEFALLVPVQKNKFC